MATILIIDDDPDSVSILETFLEARGHAAHGAADGEAGLAAVDELEPDVVILDVMMPGMDGWEVARRIRRQPRHADLRILMLTARDSQEARREGEAAGADAYMVKPVGLEDLGAGVDRLLGDGPGAGPTEAGPS
ncbi:MAG: response regulator [Longimicrobiales bacterium]